MTALVGYSRVLAHPTVSAPTPIEEIPNAQAVPDYFNNPNSEVLGNRSDDDVPGNNAGGNSNNNSGRGSDENSDDEILGDDPPIQMPDNCPAIKRTPETTSRA